MPGLFFFERKLRETKNAEQTPLFLSLAPLLVIKLMDCHKRQRWSKKKKNSHKYAFHYTQEEANSGENNLRDELQLKQS